MSRMQDGITSLTTNDAIDSYAGIDISKRTLDVFVHPADDFKQFDNDAGGLQKLIRYCYRHRVRLIALEATGLYHRTAHKILHEAGLSVTVVNPFRIQRLCETGFLEFSLSEMIFYKIGWQV